MSLSSLLFAVVAAGIGFGGGWVMRRAASSGETQALRRSMYESKGAIPQLEASLRTRDQRISMYQSESEQMRSRITQLESQISQKDNEIVRRDRDIRRLTSELEIAKESGGGETAAGDEPLPGGRIWATAHWVVEHCIGPLGVGALIVKPLRHCLHLGDLTPDEAQELGPLLQRVSLVIQELTQAD